MNGDGLDPLIHVPTRLKIVATLAALPDGDGLSFTRLQDLLELTPGNLIIALRKLEEDRLPQQREDQERLRSENHGDPDPPGPGGTWHLNPDAARPARRPLTRNTVPDMSQPGPAWRARLTDA